MAALLTIKSLLLGVLLVMTFATFILSIIDINKDLTYYGSYAPGVVALLVAGILGTLYNLWLVVTGGRRAINSVMNVLAVQTVLAGFYLGVAIVITVLRYRTNYCQPGPARDASDCVGIIKALIAFAWVDFALTLIWMGVVAAAASSYGGFRTPLGDQLPVEQLEAREAREKQPGH